MRFVVVTGMSGAGKLTAQKMLEDMGYYCVDNLPVQLIVKFAELLYDSERDKVVLGIDVRADQSFDEVKQALDEIKEKGYGYEMLFLDASNKTLLKRYKETRRNHPLSMGGRVEEGIDREREILEETKANADYVIDTSHLLTRELREELENIFIKNENYKSLMVNITSFGFKHGILQDADLVFDVRFLPNPYYVDELKQKTGNDKEVQDFVLQFEETEVFLNKIKDLLDFLIPNYIKEGKNQLVIGVGCTGGKHRSVTLANEIYKALKEDDQEYGVTLNHRDIGN
ncbi:MAG: RNase adapter RapZ [Lachnospiraceae bacterium]|nr:RNase adapter RapZ [Lachnospiraceae bacterium]MBP5276462.1 RNase adapter RapZ [Lachnospiraceae bacterium]MBP5564899.1 RNase adapter RapZ [Lachnospiraceae bacterium]MBQ4275539.1 RNase adapter RapZ [Lachnospiraceae bacterium]